MFYGQLQHHYEKRHFPGINNLSNVRFGDLLPTERASVHYNRRSNLIAPNSYYSQQNFSRYQIRPSYYGMNNRN